MIQELDFETVRKWIRGSRNLAGPLMTISDPTVVETLLPTGADLIIVDMEHSLISTEQLRSVCIAAGKTPVFARIKGLEKNEIKMVLDTGVTGIIVPGIETTEDARLAVEYSRFAPEGRRGAGPGRASGFGTRIVEYVKGRPIVFVQIETKPAYEKVKEIAKTVGLDGLFIGPFDLSIALQINFSWGNPQFVDAVQVIISEARKNDLMTGIYSSLKNDVLQRTSLEGFNFIMLGMDREAIVSGYSDAIKSLKREPWGK